METRSRTYSDRLTPPMFKDPSLLNWSGNPVLLEYGDLWRLNRRIFNNWLNARAATQFHWLQEHQARLMLQRFVNIVGNSNPFGEVKRTLYYNMASTTLRLAYGYRLQDDNDQVFQNIQQTSHYTALAAMFTNFFVNIFPSLTHVPDWFPGTGWKRTAREWRAFKDYAQSVPYEWTKTQLAAGTAEPSVLSILFQDHNVTSNLSAEEKESCFKEIAMMIVAAGTDTVFANFTHVQNKQYLCDHFQTATALVSFVAAMVLNPHVQAKAQKEIEEVLGPMSLPTMADQERLPYIRHLVQEVLRWQPPAPAGVPHACWQDDIYRGYNIEKGTVVMGNIWAMTRDESAYKDPESFDPDRFLDSNVPYPPAFGWGRRKCPGIHFAQSSLFIIAASLLATFRFSKKKDANGQEITPQLELVSNSIIMELKPFEFEVEFRSDRHRQLVQEYNS
ncbi:Cytochrome P450 2U1 [Rattus norvegicus] [Rhizoctonia solani]|uniref:Cytochrome P450 2U1 [Rattus norvegicus] n=1 Tax=Rhizoctonia solani TaxID=456999 RepID=A0A0K6GHF9_9AGAM|nr:Cytochrome P450 2U1 [Rattus norvegicus] [Rhizoctonia solani]